MQVFTPDRKSVLQDITVLQDRLNVSYVLLEVSAPQVQPVLPHVEQANILSLENRK